MPSVPASPDDDAAIRSGTAWRDFVAEREEILRHKWYMSERAGRDVGLEAALLSWVDSHHAAWRRQRSGKRQAD